MDRRHAMAHVLLLVSVLLGVTRICAQTCATTCTAIDCSAGFSQSVVIQTDGTLGITCLACPANQIKTSAGTDGCVSCPVGFQSSDGLNCVCPAYSILDSAGTGCEDCPLGGDCSVAGANVTNLDIEPGYWRASSLTTDIRVCYNFDACVGGTVDTEYCATGYDGPYCATCTSDHYISGYYMCKECSNGKRAHKIITIVIFIAVIIAGVLLLVHYGYRGTADDPDPDSGTNTWISSTLAWCKTHVDSLLVKFKILVTHFQIVAGLPLLLQADYPANFTNICDTLAIFNLDFWGILADACFFTPNFARKIVFVTLLPLSIILVVIIAHTIRCKRMKLSPEQVTRSRNAACLASLVSVFMFYVVVSTTVLQAFDCDEFEVTPGEASESFLRADYSLSCNSDQYKAVRGYAIAMAIIYPAGIPALFALLLLINRKKVTAEDRLADPSIQKYQFLWGSYRRGAFLFEVFNTVYKLMMSGMLIYFKPGTASQAVVAMLIVLVALWMQMYSIPYRHRDENQLSEASLWATLLTLLLGLLIKSGVTEEESYNIDAWGVMLSVINIGLIGLAVLQLLLAVKVWAMGGKRDDHTPPRHTNTKNKQHDRRISRDTEERLLRSATRAEDSKVTGQSNNLAPGRSPVSIHDEIVPPPRIVPQQRPSTVTEEPKQTKTANATTASGVIAPQRTSNSNASSLTGSRTANPTGMISSSAHIKANSNIDSTSSIGSRSVAAASSRGVRSAGSGILSAPVVEVAVPVRRKVQSDVPAVFSQSQENIGSSAHATQQSAPLVDMRTSERERAVTLAVTSSAVPDSTSTSTSSVVAPRGTSRRNSDALSQPPIPVPVPIPVSAIQMSEMKAGSSNINNNSSTVPSHSMSSGVSVASQPSIPIPIQEKSAGSSNINSREVSANTSSNTSTLRQQHRQGSGSQLSQGDAPATNLVTSTPQRPLQDLAGSSSRRNSVDRVTTPLNLTQPAEEVVPVAVESRVGGIPQTSTMAPAAVQSSTSTPSTSYEIDKDIPSSSDYVVPYLSCTGPSTSPVRRPNIVHNSMDTHTTHNISTEASGASSVEVVDSKKGVIPPVKRHRFSDDLVKTDAQFTPLES